MLLLAMNQIATQYISLLCGENRQCSILQTHKLSNIHTLLKLDTKLPTILLHEYYNYKQVIKIYTRSLYLVGVYSTILFIKRMNIYPQPHQQAQTHKQHLHCFQELGAPISSSKLQALTIVDNVIELNSLFGFNNSYVDQDKSDSRTASGATNQSVFIAIWAANQLIFIFIKDFLASTTIRTRDESNISTCITDLPWPNCTNRKSFQKLCQLTSLVKLFDDICAAYVISFDEDLR